MINKESSIIAIVLIGNCPLRMHVSVKLERHHMHMVESFDLKRGTFNR